METGHSSSGAIALPARRRPADVLSCAQKGREVVQDYCPFPDSLEWRIGQRYLRKQGSRAFISDISPVPYVINNDGILSRNAAALLFENLLLADASGALEAEIVVLELGIGVGLFARLFLDTIRDLSIEHGKDYYERLTYVAGDYSERMLRDAAKRGVFAQHPGRVLMRVVDAMHPETVMDQCLPSQASKAPFRAVFLNYLLDCLPATVLRVQEREVAQLCVKTSLARGVDLSAFTSLPRDELVERARKTNWSEEDSDELTSAFEGFTSDYDFQPTSASAIPHGEFGVGVAKSREVSHLLHSYGAIQSLEKLLGLLRQDGFILMSDYGHTDVIVTEDFEHQRFSLSVFVAVNFGELKAYFSDSGRGQWAAPVEDNASIHARLLGHKLAAELVELFQSRFSKQAHDEMQTPAAVARTLMSAGRFEAAANAYRLALERQPSNWLLMSEVARFLMSSLKDPASGAAMVRAAISLNPACSAELWNTYGDCLFATGRVNEARQAFQRALQINSKDARAHFNLSFVFLQERNLDQALVAIANSLVLDKPGEFRQALLQKQSEVLAMLAQQYQQDCLRSLNRTSRVPTGQQAAKGLANPKVEPIAST